MNFQICVLLCAVKKKNTTHELFNNKKTNIIFEFCGAKIFELLDDSPIKSELEEDIFNVIFIHPKRQNLVSAKILWNCKLIFVIVTN